MSSPVIRRREFVATVGALSMAPAVGAASVKALPGVRPESTGADVALWGERTLRDHVTRSVFDQHVGERFEFVLGSGARVPADLVGSADVRSEPRRRKVPAPARQVFSVDFRAPADAGLDADVAYLKHPVLGRVLLRDGLRLARVGPDSGGVRYTAFFN